MVLCDDEEDEEDEDVDDDVDVVEFVCWIELLLLYVVISLDLIRDDLEV